MIETNGKEDVEEISIDPHLVDIESRILQEEQIDASTRPRLFIAADQFVTYLQAVSKALENEISRHSDGETLRAQKRVIDQQIGALLAGIASVETHE